MVKICFNLVCGAIPIHTCNVVGYIFLSFLCCSFLWFFKSYCICRFIFQHYIRNTNLISVCYSSIKCLLFLIHYMGRTVITTENWKRYWLVILMHIVFFFNCIYFPAAFLTLSYCFTRFLILLKTRMNLDLNLLTSGIGQPTMPMFLSRTMRKFGSCLSFFAFRLLYYWAILLYCNLLYSRLQFILISTSCKCMFIVLHYFLFGLIVEFFLLSP